MLFPPSLPIDILERSFRATNGEIGVQSDDVEAFLAVCEKDRVEVLGWELWLVDHIFRPDSDEPQREDGSVWGTIPPRALTNSHQPAVFGGTGDADQTRNELVSLNLEREIKPQWLKHVRFNFTLT